MPPSDGPAERGKTLARDHQPPVPSGLTAASRVLEAVTLGNIGRVYTKDQVYTRSGCFRP
jgi:hypothetical protein